MRCYATLRLCKVTMLPSVSLIIAIRHAGVSFTIRTAIPRFLTAATAASRCRLRTEFRCSAGTASRDRLRPIGRPLLFAGTVDTESTPRLTHFAKAASVRYPSGSTNTKRPGLGSCRSSLKANVSRHLKTPQTGCGTTVRGLTRSLSARSFKRDAADADARNRCVDCTRMVTR